MAEKEEIERLMRTARMRTRTLDGFLEEGDHKKVVQEAYNVMYMAARATLNHLGSTAVSHRAVASAFRKELIGRGILNRKYQDHLRKIRQYRDETLGDEAVEIDKEKAEKIIAACKDFIRVLSDIIKQHPEPLIDYDISDFA